MGLRVADERKILDPVDTEKHRRMCRVEDLVATLRKHAQQTEQMPLRMGAQIQLGLLDQQHEAPQVRGQQALHAHDELEAAVGPRPVVLGVGRLEELGDVGSAAPAGGCDEGA